MRDLNIYYRSIVCYKLETVCICHQFAVPPYTAFGEKRKKQKQQKKPL